jgi:2-methylcitrate dehydratase PrpD
MAFIGATSLRNDCVDIEHCRGDALTDPATHDLARLIVTEVDGNPDPNALSPQKVEVDLHTGETLIWSCEVMLGNPARPLSREQHIRKFTRCVDFARDALPADGLIDSVDRLDQLGDARTLCALLAPAR